MKFNKQLGSHPSIFPKGHMNGLAIKAMHTSNSKYSKSLISQRKAEDPEFEEFYAMRL